MDYYNCKVCSNTTRPFLNFSMPLAGLFLDEQNQPATKYPLSLCFCDTCSLVQVNETTDPHVLFDKYMYKTGAIQTLKKHFEAFAQTLKDNFKFDTILEIGCNDFTFLKNFDTKRCIGVDPSDVANKALSDYPNIQLYNTFFSTDLADNILSLDKNIDIIYASNCFAHIPTIKNIVDGISKLLTETSIFITEVHWLGTVIKDLQFPFIYHEHMFYYSYKSIAHLLSLYNIEIFKVEHIDTHGGSIRYYCAKQGTQPIDGSVYDLIKEEELLKLYEFNTFTEFTNRIIAVKQQIHKLLDEVSLQNNNIVAYGASGQANTFLSFCELDNSKIDYIVDDSPLKIGKFTSSGRLPIKSSQSLYDQTPSYILCLAYTFFKEIINKHKNLKTKWIIPLPEYHIIDNS
jgi:hypothetical protein